jgi:hypothetical protein
MNEADFMRHLLQLASRLGSRLFRQQTGTGWVGTGKVEQVKFSRLVEVHPGDVILRKARPFHTGFPGWSDCGGWRPVVITEEMVGQTIAQYTVAEIKLDAKVTSEQQKFIAAVNKAGGRAGIVRSEADMEKLLLGK